MEHNDKKLEAFVKKLMANDKLEKPSADFTNNVLKQLNVESKAIVYKPLIPKWMWLVVALSVLLILSYSLLFNQDAVSGSKLSELLRLSKFEFNVYNDISFNFSKTLIYSVVAFALMIGLQIPLLKSYINRRMQF